MYMTATAPRPNHVRIYEGVLPRPIGKNIQNELPHTTLSSTQSSLDALLNLNVVKVVVRKRTCMHTTKIIANA